MQERRAPSEQALLNLIQSRQATSQVELARSLRVPANTVHGIVRRLLEEGVIVESNAERRGRGRPHKHFQIRIAGPILTITVSGTEWQSAIVTDPSVPFEVSVLRASRVPDRTLAMEWFARIRDMAVEAGGIRVGDLRGAMVHVRRPSTTRRSSVMPWVAELDEAVCTEVLGVRTLVSRDVSSEHLELCRWSREGVRSVVVFNVGDGVSAHYAAHVGPWAELQTLPGEVGHVVVDPGGARCGCGQRGCLETLLSGRAVVDRVRAELQKGVRSQLAPFVDLPPVEFFNQLEALEAGDDLAHRTVEELLRRCALGIGTTSNLFCPDLTVLRGYVLFGRQDWLNRIAAALPGVALRLKEEYPPLAFSRLESRDLLRELASEFFLRSRANGN